MRRGWLLAWWLVFFAATGQNGAGNRILVAGPFPGPEQCRAVGQVVYDSIRTQTVEKGLADRRWPGNPIYGSQDALVRCVDDTPEVVSQ